VFDQPISQAATDPKNVFQSAQINKFGVSAPCGRDWLRRKVAIHSQQLGLGANE
jgi:hypothetical protein